MFRLVQSPLTRESQVATFLGACPSCRTPRQSRAVHVRCTSSSSQSSASSSAAPSSASGFGFPANEAGRTSSAAEQAQRSGRGRSSRTRPRVASASSPLFSKDVQNGAGRKTQNGAAGSRSGNVEASAKGKWQNKGDSSLSGDEPLPLPMTWPDSAPADREVLDKMLSCDVEIQNCKTVVYQWTGECTTCQGTGLVSFYRKRREVISKCINCLGIGSVHKITGRADIQDMDSDTDDMDDPRGSSNGSAYPGPSTNGRA